MSKKGGKIRSLFSSSSAQDHPRLPERRPSVHFDGFAASQLDGMPSEHGLHTPLMRHSEGSNSSRISMKLLERVATLESKLNGTTGTSTIVHRANLHTRPSVPYINTNVDAVLSQFTENDNASPSMNSSYVPSAYSQNWSPASTASTAATSFNSPASSGFRNKRNTPEDCQTQSKSISGGADDNVLPPIEEDSGRYLMIPVQEAPISVEPSVYTVENVAAAKVYLETHFNSLLLEASSPRSMRRKKFEQLMGDNGLSHDDRMVARQQWAQSESDHLRQTRVLKATSVSRHSKKGTSIAGFDAIRVLGKGSFGVVRLVTEGASIAQDAQEKGNDSPESSKSGDTTCISNMDGVAKHNIPTGKPLSDVFAMKVIRKSEMLRACQEGHLRAERDFLVGAEGSRWVVPLIASFQDNTNLYLVMEYMIGGDFLGLLLREDVLEEDVAK
ncbi:hypothetical protein LTR36_008766 [Oleoguttula mirabilis]|uniref:non-specific serine/threonine protein kinase n=1 Tax=Oleoguttula mirabilis TaxID=1507867 RepID=A0AAV9JTZ5_9PEZI|nr:hypothetical protein LTR36_008766 [Oleoguttula mirabilis]